MNIEVKQCILDAIYENGYLMCEVKIAFGETGDVIYKEVALEGDVEECFA